MWFLSSRDHAAPRQAEARAPGGVRLCRVTDICFRDRIKTLFIKKPKRILYTVLPLRKNDGIHTRRLLRVYAVYYVRIRRICIADSSFELQFERHTPVTLRRAPQG